MTARITTVSLMIFAAELAGNPHAAIAALQPEAAKSEILTTTQKDAGYNALKQTDQPVNQLKDPELPQLDPPGLEPESAEPSPAVFNPIEQPSSDRTLESSWENWEDTYRLGAGDEIRIDVFAAPEYSGEVLVLSDGTLSLPSAERISVRGMTLLEATDAIANRYTTYIHRPRVTLSLISLRPVRVGVVGAVERPGTYTVAIKEDGVVSFPTLTDALELAGGISAQADIRQVKVSRPNASGEEILSVNLWELIRAGDMTGDVLLRSGDTVSIPVATNLDPAEAAQLGAASFSPEFVTVYVVGEVTNPGPVQVPPNTPLNQALLAAGGFDTQRANDDSIGLVRLNADGSVEQRAVDVDFTVGINEENNPVLRENDVLVVERSGLASFSDTAGLVVSPIGRLLNGIFSIFNFLD